jgi:hypothetical protein
MRANPLCRCHCLGLVLVIFLVAIGSPCWARYISLNVKPKGEVVERFLSVSAVIANEGDESARDIRVTVEAEGHALTLPSIAEMRPHEQQTIKAALPVGALDPGSYTAVLRVGYTDANGYVLSTVALVPVSKRVNPPSPITVVMRAGDVASSGEVDVQVSNVVRRTAPVHVRLIAPRELTVTPSDTRIVLQAGQQESLRFAVRNASALPGSSYAIFAVVDAQENGAHTSTAQSERMSILAPADTPSSSFLIAALAATPIAVLLFVRLSKWAAMRIRKAPGHRVSPRRVSG